MTLPNGTAPADVFKARKSGTGTKGVPGTVITGGYIVSNETSSNLTGHSKYITFSNMLANVGIVAAGTRYFLNLVAKAGWEVVPAKGGEEYADYIEEMIHDMESPWHRVVRRSAMYRFYGFSIQEWTAKRFAKGFIGFKDIAVRPQYTIETWRRTKDKIVSVEQRDPTGAQLITLPRWKLIYIVDDSLSDSPEGLGLFRHIALSADRLQRYEVFEGCGLQSDLRGTPIGRAPLAAIQESHLSKEEKVLALKPIKDFLNGQVFDPEKDRALLLDSMPYMTSDEANRPSAVPQWGVDLVKGGVTALEDAGKAIDRETRGIARTLGIEQLLLGESNHGSYALSRDKTDNLSLIVDGSLMELAAAFKMDIVKTMFWLNGWPVEKMPKLRTESIKYRDIEEVTNALKNLAVAGAAMLPDDPAVNAIRNTLGLPEADLKKMAIETSLRNKEEEENNPKDKHKDKEK